MRNNNFVRAILKTARKAGTPFRQRVKIAIVLIFKPELQEEIEKQLLERAMSEGVVPIESIHDDGRIGSWLDLIQWLIENADVIIALIMKIIDLFSEVETDGK